MLAELFGLDARVVALVDAAIDYGYSTYDDGEYRKRCVEKAKEMDIVLGQLETGNKELLQEAGNAEKLATEIMLERDILARDNDRLKKMMLDIIDNILTDSQLDTKTKCGQTIRDYARIIKGEGHGNKNN